jgi:hypothetical protein
MALINGELAGYEIKSDADSLSRLPRQTRAFSTVFDRMFVVTTERHIDAVKAKVPKWWSVLLLSSSVNDPPFVTVQAGSANPSLDTEALLHILTRAECMSVLESHGLADGSRSKSRREIVQRIMSGFTPGRIKVAVRTALKERARRNR